MSASTTATSGSPVNLVQLLKFSKTESESSECLRQRSVNLCTTGLMVMTRY